ncbi:MAG: S1C family serine protease [Parcubacteria group bacterium]|jgi:S1-C subfamily serine protease
MKKMVFKKIFLILAIVFIGGLGGIIADRYIFPYLSSTDYFMKHDWLKKAAEDITVINKTEQVFVKEETSITKISNQISASVVGIISYPQTDAKNFPRKSTTSVGPTYGTGLIVTSDGLIMTYADAINLNNSKYKVVAYDGNSYDAEISGTDAYSNLVFLKISAGNLSAVSLGNSDDIKPGEKIIAIGINPGDFSRVYSAGLISNFNPTYNLAGKAISSSDKLEGVFEADLNSEKDYVGGPIVDYTGQVIGVMGTNAGDNAQKFFQIPSNKVAKVIDRAIKKELENDPVLGIYYIPLTKSYFLVNNLNIDRGALIYSPSGQSGLAMISGSAGQKAGLQINDIITKINDQEININHTLPDLLYQYKKGDLIELVVSRSGQEMKIPVQL